MPSPLGHALAGLTVHVLSARDAAERKSLGRATLLVTIGGSDVTIYEDRSRPNYFMEVFRFKDDAEFTAFDDKFHKDRKIAAIYALLDDIVEAEKSDFKIFERRL